MEKGRENCHSEQAEPGQCNLRKSAYQSLEIGWLYLKIQGTISSKKAISKSSQNKEQHGAIKLQNEEIKMLRQKHLKRSQWTEQTRHEKLLILCKSFLLYTIELITLAKNEIILALHDKIAPLTRRYSEQGTRYYEQRFFRKVWTRYKTLIKRWILDDSDETEISLPF